MVEKIVHLNALDLDVSIPEDIQFHDDGFVEDLGGHEYFVNWKYQGKFPKLESLSTTPETQGHILYTANLQNFHIAYLKSSSYPIKTRGHEETHFLEIVDRLSFLSLKILQRQGVEIDFSRIKKGIDDLERQSETIADIGGIFCLYQRNGWESVREYYHSNSYRSREFDNAFKIYSTAIEESLKKSKNSKSLLPKLKNLF